LTIPKCNIVYVKNALLQGAAWHFQHIFGLWISPKYYIGEFNKATFLVVGRYCELIFCLKTNTKCDLDEVEKTIIQVVEWHNEEILCFLTNPK